jgi:hypothetical protein
VRLGDVHQPGDRANPNIVDQTVKAPKASHGSIDDLRTTLNAADVTRCSDETISTHLVNRARYSFGISTINRYPRTRRIEHFDGTSTDSGCAARYEYAFPGEVHVTCLSITRGPNQRAATTTIELSRSLIVRGSCLDVDRS